MRFVAISDLHSMLHQVALPKGDALLIAGDLTNRGSWREIQQFAETLAVLPFKHKVVIAGNHDHNFERWPQEARDRLEEHGIIYLMDQMCTLEGIKIYGSPWVIDLPAWAFNMPREAMERVWSGIPSGLDILMTHQPPHGILNEAKGGHCGCPELARAVALTKPRYHVFGHIHEGYGEHRNEHTHFFNVSTCTIDYKPTNLPVVFDVETL